MIGNTLFIMFSSISILISSILVVLFWKRRNIVGAMALCFLCLAATEWAFFFLLSVLSDNINTKIFFDDLTFIGVVTLPVLWFIFCVNYSRQDNVFKNIHYVLFSIIPVITLMTLFMDFPNNLFIEARSIGHLSDSTLHVIEYDFGPWFWVHIAYTYSLILSGMGILIKKLISTIRVYRNQAIAMILAILIPIMGAIKFILGIGPYENLDLTPISFSLGGIMLFIGMFRYKLLDLVPIAREAVIETMSELVIVLDTQNRIIDINKSARNIIYKKNNSVIGQPIQNLISSLVVKQDKDEVYIDIDGIKKCYNFAHSPLLNKRNTIIGSFVVLNDITDLKETMDSLEKAKLMAESANKAKSDFLATMSHEIRTPINGIIGMSELLESASLTAKERENLKALQYSADSLLNIINEILDISKIEAGMMQIDNTNFNIRELVNNTAKTFQYHRKIGDINLYVEIDDKIPNILYGDYTKLRQILFNLLSNAFKFTEAGEIKVNASLMHNNEQEVLLGFSISDTGIGIAEDKIDDLFESFHQLDRSASRKYGGTGLGLSIVKKLIELMGGSISVESSLGKGSTFFFQLPFKIADESTHVLDFSEASAASEVINLKILVAEDSRINQMLISQLLQKKSWKADIAENGIEALRMLKDNTYDLILMDIQMPEMDGYAATAAIREYERSGNTHIPIIALTANATQEDSDKCLDSGMDDFLSKPIKSDKLYECILKHV